MLLEASAIPTNDPKPEPPLPKGEKRHEMVVCTEHSWWSDVYPHHTSDTSPTTPPIANMASYNFPTVLPPLFFLSGFSLKYSVGEIASLLNIIYSFYFLY